MAHYEMISCILNILPYAYFINIMYFTHIILLMKMVVGYYIFSPYKYRFNCATEKFCTKMA